MPRSELILNSRSCSPCYTCLTQTPRSSFSWDGTVRSWPLPRRSCNRSSDCRSSCLHAASANRREPLPLGGCATSLLPGSAPSEQYERTPGVVTARRCRLHGRRLRCPERLAMGDSASLNSESLLFFDCGVPSSWSASSRIHYRRPGGIQGFSSVASLFFSRSTFGHRLFCRPSGAPDTPRRQCRGYHSGLHTSCSRLFASPVHRQCTCPPGASCTFRGFHLTAVIAI